jgi:hypothetical protein
MDFHTVRMLCVTTRPVLEDRRDDEWALEDGGLEPLPDTSVAIWMPPPTPPPPPPTTTTNTTDEPSGEVASPDVDMDTTLLDLVGVEFSDMAFNAQRRTCQQLDEKSSLASRVQADVLRSWRVDTLQLMENMPQGRHLDSIAKLGTEKILSICLSVPYLRLTAASHAIFLAHIDDLLVAVLDRALDVNCAHRTLRIRALANLVVTRFHMLSMR